MEPCGNPMLENISVGKKINLCESNIYYFANNFSVILRQVFSNSCSSTIKSVGVVALPSASVISCAVSHIFLINQSVSVSNRSVNFLGSLTISIARFIDYYCKYGIQMQDKKMFPVIGSLRKYASSC